jgi:hypothetical protein
MKKVIFGFVATAMFSTFSFANTPTLENEVVIKNENKVEAILVETDLEEDEIICTVTCSVTIDGITHTVSAGNWFSSCERAARRCNEKLLEISDWW